MTRRANGTPEPLLRLEGINTYYGQMHILQDVNLEIGEDELVCLLGGNASGKSTTLKTILGIVPPRSGSVVLAGENVTGFTTARRIERGLAIVPENRRLFGPMTVLENLEMGAYLRPRADLSDDLDRVYTLFPLLSERRKQLAGTLSGGEQQMVAMGRALMARPKLLLMDEPSMGLAPILVERSFEIIEQVHDAGVALLIVEQNANVSLSIADRGYVLSTGRIVLEGKASELLQHEELRRPTLGVRGRFWDQTPSDPGMPCEAGFRSSSTRRMRTPARRAPSRWTSDRPTTSTSPAGISMAPSGSTGSSARMPPGSRSRAWSARRRRRLR